MNRLLKIVYTCAAILLLLPFGLFAFPRLPTSMSWEGTGELAAGSLDSALAIVTRDIPATTADTLLRMLKLGMINVHMRNIEEAERMFRAVSRRSPLLSPIAHEQTGDMAMVQAGDSVKAMAAYSAALRGAGLPAAYRNHLFAKIRALADHGISIPFGMPWIVKYRQWDTAGLEALCDSQISVGVDSLWMQSRSDRHVQNTLWLHAWNHESAGRFRDAAAGYRRVFAKEGSRTEEAHYRHALCYYKLKQYDSAIVYFNTFQQQFPQSTYLRASMFWQGSAHRARGRTEEAHRIWNKIDPADYHAHRAKQLMGADTDAALPLATQMTDAQARAWLDSVPPVSTRKMLSSQDTTNLRRGGALLAIAQPDLADVFLWEYYDSDFSGNLQLQYELATGYALAGDYARSFDVARRLAWRIPMQYRVGMPLQVLTIMYPAFYSPIIIKYSELFGVDPFFVSAVMRQESMFNKNIVSPAGAIGLMQIMPATGRLIAKELKVTYEVDSLYSPAYNIKFGVYYLSKRLTQFNGDEILALAAYNGGAGNAIKWRNQNKNACQDIFNENIGFRETRIYVKRVMAGYWTYEQLATTPGYDYNLPITAHIMTMPAAEE